MTNSDEVKFGEIVMPHYQGVYGSTHRLTLDWCVRGELPDGRRFVLIVREGFTFDGASIPRWLWRVCGHPLEVPRVAAALAHDWLYAAHVCDRATADAIYKALMLAVGISSWRAAIEHAALRCCGAKAYRDRTTGGIALARQRGSLIITPSQNPTHKEAA